MPHQSLADAKINSFEEFWPYYLREHAHPLNRALHVAGTSAGLLCAAAGLATFNPWLVAAAPVAGYGAAWFGHFVIEKNKPASFRYPGWSLRGDLRMLHLTLTGRLGPHLDAAFGA